jgi:DNA-directed RNA polymerase specialized sigma24 family protein
MGAPPGDEFDAFVRDVEPRLRRALLGSLAPGVVSDAVGEALAYAWQHWEEVRLVLNPGGFLFRVAQSRSRQRREGFLPGPEPSRLPDVEPELGVSMRSLPQQQRMAVWLVVACGWTYAEAAEAMSVSASSIGTHVARGLARLRQELGVGQDA